METITSKDNKTIRYISKLNNNTKFRKKEGYFTIEGKRLCNDAILSNVSPKFCIFSESFYSSNTDICNLFISKSENSFCCNNTIFSSISDTVTPQGVLFVVKTLDKNSHEYIISNKNEVVLLLDCIQDPTNLGTILRSCEAFGIKNVVLSSDSCDIYSPKVLRGSMGAIFRLNFQYCKNISEFVDKFNEFGYSYASVLDEHAISISDISFKKPCLLIVGNEGNGISKEIIEKSTHKVYIDMNGKAESLNASVAASILMYELSKTDK